MAGFISAELQNAWRTRPKLGTLASRTGSRLQSFALYAGGVATVTAGAVVVGKAVCGTGDAAAAHRAPAPWSAQSVAAKRSLEAAGWKLGPAAPIGLEPAAERLEALLARWGAETDPAAAANADGYEVSAGLDIAGLRVELMNRAVQAYRSWAEREETTRRAVVFNILDDKRAQAIEDYGKDL